ncbi:MAG: hypothetical protein EP329_12900 [Deltaproteobacteria bacterium]|nr:MAG: hypothetical protein EP329_12900 [Deltaproteobacteria bacterium]
MKHLSLRAIPSLALVALLATAAQADTLGPTQQSERGYITNLSKGLMEVGLDSLIVWTSRSLTVNDIETSSSEMTLSVGPTFRYFVIDNLGVALNVNALVTRRNPGTEAVTEMGVLALLDVDYYLKLGKGMFFKPGVGAGGLFKTRSEPIDPANPSIKQSFNTTGGAFRVQLGFVYYTSPKFNLKACLDFLGQFGTTKSDNVPDQSLFQMDLGWNVGAAYVF